MPEPDHAGAAASTAKARAKYRRIAASYDLRLATGRALHRRAVARLDPQPGETILDVGCGTGLAFPLLEERVGPPGGSSESS